MWGARPPSDESCRVPPPTQSFLQQDDSDDSSGNYDAVFIYKYVRLSVWLPVKQDQSTTQFQPDDVRHTHTHTQSCREMRFFACKNVFEVQCNARTFLLRSLTRRLAESTAQLSWQQYTNAVQSLSSSSSSSSVSIKQQTWYSMLVYSITRCK